MPHPQLPHLPKHHNKEPAPPGTSHTTKSNYTCRSTKVVYLVTCKRCHKQYVGQTVNSLHTRIQKMKTDIKHNTTRESTYHFRNNQHTTNDIQIEIIDHVDIQMDRKSAEKELHRKETHWINTLSTITPLGLNYIHHHRYHQQNHIIHKTTNHYTHKPPSTYKQNTKTTTRMLPPPPLATQQETTRPIKTPNEYISPQTPPDTHHPT